MSHVECPDHPGHKILAYQQTSFTTPCSIELDMGQIEIEMDDRAEHVREMETTTIVCYLCSVDGCGWTILPEQLSDYSDKEVEVQAQLAANDAAMRQAQINAIPPQIGPPSHGRAVVPTSDRPIPQLVQEDGESDDDFGRREDAVRTKARNESKAAAEAKGGLSPLDKFKGVFGGP